MGRTFDKCRGIDMKRVTFETARWLKEVGYPQDKEFTAYYNEDGILIKPYVFNTGKEVADAPTYLEVWLWLWREKKYRILLSASNQRWDEVHGVVDGVDGIVETSWHRGLPGYDATDHKANHTDPEKAIIAAIEYLVDKLSKTKETKFKYETIMEDWHGHCRRDRFEAASDEEAKRIVNEKGFNYFGSHDCLWRVCGDYVDHSHFTEEEEEKMKRNYIEIKC